MAFDPITSALIIDKGVGIPPNDMQSFSAISNDSGIKLTFTGPANSYMDKGGTNETLLCTPSGVLVCYSETGYPEDVSEGTVVGLFNEDYDPESPQQFEYDVVGLTFGNTYYFTAFPVSVEGAYNKSKSANNRSTCKWEGTKGTLTVTVTQDYGYQTLGEYTVTMTPTAGGEAIVKTQSGEATIVFSNLDDGEYTLSFSDVRNFITPSSQRITVVGGQSQSVRAEYLINLVLQNLTWQEISDFGAQGLAKELFSVGDTKTFKAGSYTLTARIIDFDHDDLSSGGKAPITFDTVEVYPEEMQWDSNTDTSTTVYYNKSDINEWLNVTLFKRLESDLQNNIKTVSKKYVDNANKKTTSIMNVKLWLVSDSELSDISSNGDYANEGSKYSYYSNDSRLNKGSCYWERSIDVRSNKLLHYVSMFCDDWMGGWTTRATTNHPAIYFCV